MDRCFDFHQINADNDTHTHYSVCNKSVHIQFSAQDALLEYKRRRKKKKIGNNTLQPANYDHYYKLLPIKRC